MFRQFHSSEYYFWLKDPITFSIFYYFSKGTPSNWLSKNQKSWFFNFKISKVFHTLFQLKFYSYLISCRNFICLKDNFKSIIFQLKYCSSTSRIYRSMGGNYQFFLFFNNFKISIVFYSLYFSIKQNFIFLNLHKPLDN